jgi:hypothetical protein
MQPVRRSAEAWTYTPIADRDDAIPVEQRTVFRLRPLAQAERVAALDEVARTVITNDGTTTIQKRERQVSYGLCLTHIEAVEHFPPDAPKPWPDTEKERKEFLNTIDDDVVHEVGNEIFDRSSIGVAEKNS